MPNTQNPGAASDTGASLKFRRSGSNDPVNGQASQANGGTQDLSCEPDHAEWVDVVDACCDAWNDYALASGFLVLMSEPFPETNEEFDAVERRLAMWTAAAGRKEAAHQALIDATGKVARMAGPLSGKAAEADALRELGEEFGLRWLDELADTISPPPNIIRSLEAFTAAYRGAFVEFFVGKEPTAEALAALRAATLAVQRSEPRTEEELGRKVRVAICCGMHVRLKRTCDSLAQAGAEFRRQRKDLDLLPIWFAGYLAAPELTMPRPVNIDPSLLGEGFARDMLEAAGEAWKRVIGADVERLRVARGEGALESVF